MNVNDPLLIALLPTPRALALARTRGVYRVPLAHAPATLASAAGLAFYQPASFDEGRWQVAWWAKSSGLEVMTRRELLPDEPDHRRADELYVVVRLGDLQPVEPPKRSEKGRRLLFVPTTWGAFQRAATLDELFERAPRPIADAPLYQILKQQLAGHEGVSALDRSEQLRLLEPVVDYETLDW